MSEQESLFEMPSRPLRKGDSVVVQTIWGDEGGIVSRVIPDTYYYTLVEVALQRGDTITIPANRVVTA